MTTIPPKLLRRLAAAGCPGEYIAIVIEELEALDEQRRADLSARKRRSRDRQAQAERDRLVALEGGKK